MAYVAVSGGKEAIRESIRLLKYHRCSNESRLELEALEKSLGILIHRVMGEAGLYSPAYAALALKQCEGSVEEAVFLLRAYRNTLTRSYYTEPASTDNMRVIRRISSVFKDIPGGQILGPSYDYTFRTLDMSLMDEDAKEAHEAAKEILQSAKPEEPEPMERVSKTLEEQGLLEKRRDEREPFDITKEMIKFPCPRSARLQTLSRADSGFITGIAYSAMRGYGFSNHPTIAELRSGYLEMDIAYPLDDSKTICLGEILLTEVVSLIAGDSETNAGKLVIKEGYGLVFGRCESKAIAMSILDVTLDEPGSAPCNDEEYCLMHGDVLEMNGYISHLKLPHYVTFQSKLAGVRKTKGAKE